MAGDVARLLLTWVAYVAALAAALYVAGWPGLWLAGRARARGWRPWAVWLVAGAFVAAAAAPLLADVERRARIAKARGDVVLLGKAVDAYTAHCGGPPATGAGDSDCRVASVAARAAPPGALLKTQRNARGVEAGPFLPSVPRLPLGWTGVAGRYVYVVDANGRARVCAAGDGGVADSRGTGACPTDGR